MFGAACMESGPSFRISLVKNKGLMEILNRVRTGTLLAFCIAGFAVYPDAPRRDKVNDLKYPPVAGAVTLLLR